jgi:hypothetical protein
MLPVPAAGQQVLSSRLPRAQAGLGMGVFNVRDVSRPPACVELGLPCSVSGDRSESSVFGGSLWLSIAVATHVAVVAEASGYSQPWPETSPAESGDPSLGKNDAWFLLAGLRFNLPARPLARRVIGPPSTGGAAWRGYGQVLLGAARGDRAPGGRAILLASGLEMLEPCRSSLTCLFAGEVGYRRVATAGHLSGLQVLLRIGFGF